MATLRTKSYLLTRFEAGDRPTDVDFADLFESICILGETGLGSPGSTTGFDGNVTIGGTLTLTGQLQMPAELMVGSITETLSMPIQAYTSQDETVIFASGSISDNIFQGVSGDSTSSIRLQDDLTHVRFGTHTNKGFLEVHGEEIIHYTTGSSTTDNVIYMSGSLGIGTTSPGGNLHVVGTAGGSGEIYLSDVDNGVGTGDALLINKSGTSAFIYNRDSGDLNLGTNDQSSYVHIKSTGEVGIGTVNPSARLDIVTTGDEGLEVNVATGHFAAVFNTAYDNVAKFESTDANSSIVIQDVNSTNNSNKIEVITNTMHLTTDSNRNVTILDTGLVGIGLTGPTHKLHLFDDTNDVNLMVESTKTDGRAQIRFKNDAQEFVAGTNTADSFIIFDGTNSTTPFTIEPGTGDHTLYLDSSERVGIGKSNPDEKLTIHAGHVSMSQGYGLIRHHTSAGNQQNYGFYPYSSGNSFSFTNISNSPTPPTALLKIESDASIGFTESDGNILNVLFDVNNKQYRFDGPITASHFIGDGSGLTGVNAQQVIGFISNDSNNFVTTAVGNGTLNGEANLQFDGSQLLVVGDVSASGNINVNRGSFIAFYGNGSEYHSIGALNENGNASDDIRINSYNNVFIDLDSNDNNNDDTTSFKISQHSNTGALNDPLFIVGGDGKVGIGTSSPTSLLHIHAVGSGVAATASLHIESDGSSKDSTIHLRQAGALNASTGVDLVYDGDDDYFMLKGHTFSNGLEGEGFKYKPETDDNTLVLKQNYKIGMGTISPQHNLHIVSGSGHPSIMIETEGAGDGAFIRFKDDNQHWRIGKNTGDNFALYDSTGNVTPFSVEKTAPDSTLYLENTGNVGIGTSSPSQKLHVKGGDHTAIQVDSSDGTDKNAFIKLTNDTRSFSLKVIGSNNHLYIVDETEGSSPFKLTGGSPSNTLVLNNGKVGIGTDAPTADLEVTANEDAILHIDAGTGGTPADNDAVLRFQRGGDSKWGILTSENVGLRIYDYVANADHTFFETGGNVGIGTTNPSAILHLNESGDDLGEVEFLKMHIASSTTEGTGSIVFADADDPDDQNMKIRFYEGARNRLSFDVRAVISATNHVSDNILVLETNNAGGRVGINTFEPTHNLHVVGDTNITGDLTLGGNIVGGGITFPLVPDTGGVFPIRQTALTFPGTDDRAIIDYGFTADDAFEFRIVLTDGAPDRFIITGSAASNGSPDFVVHRNMSLFYPDVTTVRKVGINVPETTLDTNNINFHVSGSHTIGGATITNAHIAVGNPNGTMWGVDPNEMMVKGDHFYIQTLDAGKEIRLRVDGTQERLKVLSSTGTSSGSVQLGFNLNSQIGYSRFSSYASFSHKSLDDSSAGNYALLQSSGGETFLNASTDKRIFFRENNSTKMVLDDGVLGIGNMGNTSTQRYGSNDGNTDDTQNPYNYGDSADGRVGLHIFDDTADTNEITDYILIETKNGDVATNPGQGAGIRWFNHDPNSAAGASIRNHVAHSLTPFGQDSEGAGNLIFAVSAHGDNGKLTDRMIITGRGQIGVGTNDPADNTKFHITSGHNTGLLVEGDDTLYIALNTTDADSPVGILFREQGTNRVTMGYDGVNNQAAMLFGSGFGNNNGIRIDSSGNVSINTATSNTENDGSSTSGTFATSDSKLKVNGHILSTGVITADTFRSWNGQNVGTTEKNYWHNIFNVQLSSYGYLTGRFYVQSAGNSTADNISAILDFQLKNQSGSAPGNFFCGIHNYGPRKLKQEHIYLIQYTQGSWNGGARDGSSDAVNASSYPRVYDLWVKNDGTAHDEMSFTKLGHNNVGITWSNQFVENTVFLNNILTPSSTKGNNSSRWTSLVVQEIKHVDMNKGQRTYFGEAEDRYEAADHPRVIFQGYTDQGSAIGFQDNDSNNLWQMGYSNHVGSDSLAFMHTADTTSDPTNHAHINQMSTNALNFTGQHYCIPATGQVSDYTDHVGKIVSSTGEYVNHVSQENTNTANINEALPKVKLSDATNDKKVFGVISDCEDPNEGSRTYSVGAFSSVQEKQDDRLIINSVGEGGIWVSNYNGNLTNGDYITTSPIHGVGQKQDDDLLHNYTVAKITQDCDFDNETDLVTCQAPDGTYQMKFVGCTYHCG